MLRGMEETTQEDEAREATDSVRAGHLSSDAARRRRLFVMRAAGGRLFAVYSDEVEATSENPTTPTPLPFAPAPVRGVGSLRGRILTVIDPLLLLPPDAGTPNAAHAPTHAAPTHASIIVALKGDEQLALTVERVEHELELFDEEADAATDTSNNLPLRRTIRHRAGDILLLDPARLFDAAMQGVERRRRRT
jgi:chemotaxis signal transduction protein